MICTNSGDLVGADFGDFVLELVETFDPEGPRVGGKSGLGVSVVLAVVSTWVFVSVSTSTSLEKSIVGAGPSKFVFLELVGGLGLEGHSVGGQDGLGHIPDLGPLGDVHFNVVPGVLGAGEGSGFSFLLLHVELLDLGFHPVHLHGDLLRVGAVVLGNLEANDTCVVGSLDLAFCTV
jgi:hypothetical protein